MILFEKGNTTFNSTRVGVVVALVEGIRTREDSVMWITGTVPSSGTKEVLLYLSKDPDD